MLSLGNMVVLGALEITLACSKFFHELSGNIRLDKAARFRSAVLPDGVFTYLVPAEEFRVVLNDKYANLIHNSGAFGLPRIMVQNPMQQKSKAVTRAFELWGVITYRQSAILWDGYDFSSKYAVARTGKRIGTSRY
ncbi:hypothetical protein AG1IA_00213 [Rhizoctonia solani AG-1 IA]|uniref:Uncharacterized protein n=1 Tax=Thanatephorus cucumeris (strain AG1-IA) TaxID=983506 RepID=L8X9K0_THACA|nr:hypothetical protein AG1IA_00213 [Rhizoctonia solani AG-1 IA]